MATLKYENKESEANEASLFSESKIEIYNNLDLTPLYLSDLEKEIMIIFLDRVSNVTSALVERKIQLAFIFSLAESTVQKFSPDDITKIAKNAKVPPIYGSFLKDFNEYIKLKDPQKKKEIADKITKEYFTGEGRLSTEKKRLVLVRAINKLFPNTIPSYMKIDRIINILEAKGYIQHTIIDKKKIWSVVPAFYQGWLARRNQIIDEFEQKKKEAKTTDPLAEAMAYLFNKYNPIVLDFYKIPYWKYSTIEPKSLIIKESYYIEALTPY